MTALTLASAQLCATRAAPACASTTRSRVGVRPSKPVRLDRLHVSSLDSAAGTVRRRAAPVEAGTQAGQNLRYVPDQVIVHLGRINHEQPAALRREGYLHMFDAEVGEPVTMLDHDRGHGWACSSARNFSRSPLSAEPASVTTWSTANF